MRRGVFVVVRSGSVDADEDDPWRALGVARGASAEACKRAYKRMAKLYHPDVNRNANEQEVFLRAKSAYEMLSAASGSDLSKVQTYEWKLKWREQLRELRQKKKEEEAEEEIARVTMVGTEDMRRQIESQMEGLRDRDRHRRVRNVMKPTPVKFDEPFAGDDGYSWNHDVQ
jgi:DnaJ-class molecular chaperone